MLEYEIPQVSNPLPRVTLLLVRVEPELVNLLHLHIFLLLNAIHFIHFGVQYLISALRGFPISADGATDDILILAAVEDNHPARTAWPENGIHFIASEVLILRFESTVKPYFR